MNCLSSCAECGGTLSADRGSISSPFFPSNYPPQTLCVWNIEVSCACVLWGGSTAPTSGPDSSITELVANCYNRILIVNGFAAEARCCPRLSLSLLQVPVEKFVKVQFSKFLLGNQSNQCPDDYVKVDNQRSAASLFVVPLLLLFHVQVWTCWLMCFRCFFCDLRNDLKTEI